MRAGMPALLCGDEGADLLGQVALAQDEGGLGAGAGGAADALDRPGGLAAAEFLVIDVPVAADFDLAPFGEEIHDGDADAVQAAGGLVGALLELAAEFETRTMRRADLLSALAGSRQAAMRDETAVGPL